MEDKPSRKESMRNCMKQLRKSCYRFCLKNTKNHPRLCKVVYRFLSRKIKTKLTTPKGLPEEYFLDVDDEMLNFLEKQGEDCIREIHQSNNTNKESGQKLLGILIVGIGSAFLLLTQNKYPSFLSFGIGVFTLYWSLCAMYLILTVLSVKNRKLVSSIPCLLYEDNYKNISDDDYAHFKAHGYSGDKNKLHVMRRYRLGELCVIADEMLAVNAKTSKQLNWVRIGTILTPVLALFISVVTYFFSVSF
ncbi:TPA: hypothetical protein ACJIK4_001820 [Kluyvera cryocrescens]